MPYELPLYPMRPVLPARSSSRRNTLSWSWWWHLPTLQFCQQRLQYLRPTPGHLSSGSAVCTSLYKSIYVERIRWS